MIACLLYDKALYWVSYVPLTNFIKKVEPLFEILFNKSKKVSVWGIRNILGNFVCNNFLMEVSGEISFNEIDNFKQNIYFFKSALLTLN